MRTGCDVMYLICINKDIADEIMQLGQYKLLKVETDINGVCLWTFSVGARHFDISAPKYAGKCFYSDVVKQVFSSVKGGEYDEKEKD